MTCWNSIVEINFSTHEGSHATMSKDTVVQLRQPEGQDLLSTMLREGAQRLIAEALQSEFLGPKIIIAEGECQLNRQRRVAPLIRRMTGAGQRVVRQRFGVDADVCTGDHSCVRLSGCPSLTIRTHTDPLRRDPVAYVDNSCVGCGVCGEVAHAAVLCPSFYRADIIVNPTWWDRLLQAVRGAVIRLFAGRAAPPEVAA